MHNKDGSIHSKITECNFYSKDLYKCNSELDYSGKYFIQAKITTENNFNIQSNQLEITSNDINVEMKNIGLNREILENIALNYGGNYYDLEKLSDYLKSVKSDIELQLKLRKILIFNFQSFWFIILLFLIVEWIIRKNSGLL